jgi:hypothetical protein
VTRLRLQRILHRRTERESLSVLNKAGDGGVHVVVGASHTLVDPAERLTLKVTVP